MKGEGTYIGLLVLLLKGLRYLAHGEDWGRQSRIKSKNELPLHYRRSDSCW